MNRRIKYAVVLLLLFLCLTGCGKGRDGNEKADDGSNIAEIKKDGVILNTIEEDFSSEYYDEDSLKAFVLREAAEYNGGAGKDRVAVKKLSVKGSRVTLTMEYRTAEDFAAFNEYPFFCGTVAEAYEAGYPLDAEFYAADAKEDGEDSSIGKEQLLEMGSRRIVIAQVPDEENLTVKTSGKILYISGAEPVKKNAAAIRSGEESNQTAYIVFK